MNSANLGSLSQQGRLSEQPVVKTISPKEALLDFAGEDGSMPDLQSPRPSRMFALTPSSSSNSSSVNAQLDDATSDLDSGDDVTDFELFAHSSEYPRSVGNQTATSDRAILYDDGVDSTTQSSALSSPVASDYDDASLTASPASSIASKNQSGGYSGEGGLNILPAFSRGGGDSGDESGMQTCPDCGKRIPKTQNLQMHRRTHNSTPPRKKIPLSAQTGPHRCGFNNPVTGKPCNKIFSRPYDLIRHQETIHASNRKTFKCDLCGDDTKTFSRQDALARHIRVCIFFTSF